MNTRTLKGLEAVAFAALHSFDSVKIDGQDASVSDGRVTAYDAPERVTVEAQIHPTSWTPPFIRSLDRQGAHSSVMAQRREHATRCHPSREEFAMQAEFARVERAMWDADTARLKAAGWKRATPTGQQPEAWLQPQAPDGKQWIAARFLRGAALKRLPPAPAAAPHEPVEGEAVD